MLDLPRFGNINVHGSLLPKYRGAAPIQWAVANGETETGVTTMLLDAGLDTGNTLLFHSLPIGPDTTSPQLYPQLSQIGASLLLQTLSGLEQGTIVPQEQDHAAATLAPILTREDGRLDLVHRTAQETYNRWRGFTPWPGAHALFRGKRFLIHRMHPSTSTLTLAAQPAGHFHRINSSSAPPKTPFSPSTKSSSKANPASPAPSSPETSNSTHERVY